MRRSPRRRVTPRASSSEANGTAYFREVPSSSRSCDSVIPSGCRASSRAATRRRLIDCVRREPDAVALDHEATPHELAELAAIHIVGRGRSERLRREAPRGRDGRQADQPERRLVLARRR